MRLASVDNTSETGNAIQTPSSPYHKGSIKIRGIKKNPCLDRVSKRAGTGLCRQPENTRTQSVEPL